MIDGARCAILAVVGSRSGPTGDFAGALRAFECAAHGHRRMELLCSVAAEHPEVGLTISRVRPCRCLRVAHDDPDQEYPMDDEVQDTQFSDERPASDGAERRAGRQAPQPQEGEHEPTSGEESPADRGPTPSPLSRRRTRPEPPRGWPSPGERHRPLPRGLHGPEGAVSLRGGSGVRTREDRSITATAVLPRPEIDLEEVDTEPAPAPIVSGKEEAAAGQGRVGGRRGEAAAIRPQRRTPNSRVGTPSLRAVSVAGADAAVVADRTTAGTGQQGRGDFGQGLHAPGGQAAATAGGPRCRKAALADRHRGGVPRPSGKASNGSWSSEGWRTAPRSPCWRTDPRRALRHPRGATPA